MYANADFHGQPSVSHYTPECLKHAKSHAGNSFSMVITSFGKSCDSHVGITNGFDFLNSVRICQVIKRREDVIKQIDKLTCIHPLRKRCEAAEISK
jgi:hypothetical protein